MKKITLLLTLIYVFSPILFYAQESSKWCATMDGLEERTQTDADYAAFRQAATTVPTSAVQSIPCDGTNSVIIPVAFHFDASFTCADPSCLLTKVQEQIDALNIAFGDNSVVQQNIDLAAICPAGYPLADVSTGTCIEFKLAVPPAGQGLDPACDPAITIGQFSGGTQTDFNGAGAAWAGYLNIFVVEEVQVSIFGIPIPGIIGVADGIPGMANGDGVTLLADAFGGVGAGCNSGNDIDIGATDGANFFFTEGGTTAHEVGHYLGLYHIWGDDDLFPGMECTGDDSAMPQVGPFAVNDTPLQGTASATNAPCPTIAGATCATLPATCDGSNDYFHNYMDYSNDICMSMFTDDQSMVMNYWANELFGASTIPTFDAAPAVLTTLCEMQPCDMPVVCPVAIDTDISMIDACSMGSVQVCVIFDSDPTDLVDVSFNGETTVIDAAANTACVDITLPTNQTCDVLPLEIILSATCTEDGSNILNIAGVDINGSIGTVTVFPEPLSVVTSGDGECTTLMAQLLSADGTECAVRTMGCDGDGSSLVYNFNVDVTFAPPANCALMGLTGSIACDGCTPNCTAVAGTISTTDNLTVCALDGNDDIINATVSGQAGENFGWLITDGATGDILSMGVMASGSTTFSPNLEGAPPGACQIWAISWDGNLSGANQGDNAAGIASDVCFELSNPITVDRVEVTAGTITTSFSTIVCALDGNPDIINTTLNGQSGTNFGWLITDGATGDILSMGVMAAGSTTFSPDLEGAPVGTCQIWAISWEGNLSGANQGDNASGITSDVCFALSNPIDVIRVDCAAPTVTISDPCNCVDGIDLDGDGVNDLVQETITITDPNGAGQGWGLLNGGGLVDPDGMGGTVPTAAIATDNGDGTYTFIAYLPADGVTTYSISFLNPVDLMIGQVGGPCSSCEIIDEVPTLGEWGLIILALLMSIVAIVGIRARVEVTA